MEDLKIKAAKEYYDSVGMTLEQAKDTLSSLGFDEVKSNVFIRNTFLIMVSEYDIGKKHMIELSCTKGAITKFLYNPRYASQIQQLIKDTQ